MASISRLQAQETTSTSYVLYFSFSRDGFTNRFSRAAVCDGDGCAAAQGPRACELAKGNVASLKLRHRVLRTDEAARGWTCTSCCDQPLWPRVVGVLRYGSATYLVGTLKSPFQKKSMHLWVVFSRGVFHTPDEPQLVGFLGGGVPCPA